MKLLFLFIVYSVMVFAQDMNIKVTDERTGKQMLYGICTRDAFSDTSFKEWYDKEYREYEPDMEAVDSLNWQVTNLKMLVVFGTWCGDSRRELPRLFKILDLSGFPMDKLTLIAVDRKKETDGFDSKEKEINFVPTIILYSGTKELGRIIETPVETIEKDLLGILMKK
ncbi:MAG: thioredoxin family protein [Ignavibacteriaceae bacterium]|nr:thioredoxin family protein [Ignavibacteriaceae bacterium]